MLFYSATTKGFYDSEIHDHLPEDAVELTKDEYHALFVAQSQGKLIVSDAKGRPITSDRKAIPLTTETAAALIRQERNKRLTACDYVMISDYPISVDLRDDWVVYRQMLRDLPDEADFPWGGDLSQVPWPTEPDK